MSFVFVSTDVFLTVFFIDRPLYEEDETFYEKPTLIPVTPEYGKRGKKNNKFFAFVFETKNKCSNLSSQTANGNRRQRNQKFSFKQV